MLLLLAKFEFDGWFHLSKNMDHFFKKIGFPLKPDDIIVMSLNVHEWKGKTWPIAWYQSLMQQITRNKVSLRYLGNIATLRESIFVIFVFLFVYIYFLIRNPVCFSSVPCSKHLTWPLWCVSISIFLLLRSTRSTRYADIRSRREKRDTNLESTKKSKWDNNIIHCKWQILIIYQVP